MTCRLQLTAIKGGENALLPFLLTPPGGEAYVQIAVRTSLTEGFRMVILTSRCGKDGVKQAEISSLSSLPSLISLC